MVNSILLGMDEAHATIYKTMLTSNSRNLRVVGEPLPIFHTAIEALERYKPDIFYLNIGATSFDHTNMKDIEKEITDTIYKIRDNFSLNKIRIAVQANSRNSNEFLQQLARLNVQDIFYSAAANGQIDLTEVAEQLSKPPKISNVSEYLSDVPQTNEKVRPRSRPPRTGRSKNTRPRSAPVQQGQYSPRPLKNNQQQSIPRQPRPKQPLNQARPYAKPKQPKKRYRNKIMMTFFVGVLLIGLVFSFYSHKSGSSNNVGGNHNTPSYSSLIRRKEYGEAAKYYPKKGLDAEDKMLEDTSIDDKGKIASQIGEYNSSDAVRFDNCYFSQDYEDAANIYDTSDDSNLTNLTDARRIMVAYSLMKSGEEDKALNVAKPLHNKELTKRIETYKKFYDANTLLEDKIKKGELKGSDLQDAKEQIEVNKKEMNKL